MRNFSDKSCRENKTRFAPPPPAENHIVHETMWKNTVETDRPQMTVWGTRIAFWITKATNTHSQYVILTFPLTTMEARTRLIVTLYVHRLSGYITVTPIQVIPICWFKL